MAKIEVQLGLGGIAVPLGSHITSFYRNLSELHGIAVPFTQMGLERGARCINIVEEETRDERQEALRGHGVDIEATLACGQLSILTAEEIYLPLGYFSPEKTIELVETALRNAIEEGYKMILISEEMSWALRECPGVERLMEYEAKLHKMLANYPQVTLCHYNITKFRGETILDSLRVHPSCIVGGILIHNHFYLSPNDFLRKLNSRKH